MALKSIYWFFQKDGDAIEILESCKILIECIFESATNFIYLKELGMHNDNENVAQSGKFN